MSNNQNFIFKARTKEAFVIKVIGELLSSHVKFAPFQINKNGTIQITKGRSRKENS